jgi:hypothetical protein
MRYMKLSSRVVPFLILVIEVIVSRVIKKLRSNKKIWCFCKYVGNNVRLGIFVRVLIWEIKREEARSPR